MWGRREAKSIGARTAPSGERGVALIMVLVILLVVMVIAAGLFSFAIASTRSLKTYKEDRALRYVADGGLEYGIANAAADTTLGVTDGTNCSWSLPAEGRVTGDVSMASGSTVRVSCEPYIVSTGADSDGGQKVRYVEFTVTCFNFVGATNDAKPSCSSSGGSPKVLAKAKVRYDIDATKPVATRASIPKVLSWNLQP